ncbi:AraC family transcriptional regulator [Paraflavitalea sp. CAU 1676]|uniref:helix-turn-helix transcriptional regulator n=1 Tax=Paraflavitalea sp. CAU 1676 TaxID=3032598 RepID=UPI0023D9C9DB|nr:AraC family transcriptional regulator [Paraflavitalea sp. CAU 1676]MDF2193045.1 AraC family transcriptional regulator [Paraflavitalea sp. CAU 1676]
MSVQVLSESEGRIALSDAEPVGLWEFKIPEARSLTASGAFGDLLLQETPGNQYAVWYNNFHIKRGDRLTILHTEPVYKLQFILHNSFSFYDPGGLTTPVHERGYNFLSLPGTEERISFKDKLYSSIEIHFSPQYLQTYATGFAHLADWLGKTRNPVVSRLCKVNQIATRHMMQCIHELLYSPYTGDLRKMHYDALVNELLLLVLHETGMHPVKKAIRFTNREVESLYELKRYLIANMDKPVDLEQLAGTYGITLRTMKRRFQTLFGIKMYNFLWEIRMEQACVLLQETDTSIEQVAAMTGYQSFANFSTAFKKYYGHPPKYFRNH